MLGCFVWNVAFAFDRKVMDLVKISAKVCGDKATCTIALDTWY